MVKFNFFSKEEPVATVTHLTPRLRKIDTPSLLNWWDSTLMNLGASFDRWRFHQLPDAEVTENLDALQQIWAELQSRDKDS